MAAQFEKREPSSPPVVRIHSPGETVGAISPDGKPYRRRCDDGLPVKRYHFHDMTRKLQRLLSSIGKDLGR